MFTSLSFLLYHATLLLTPASLTHSCHITQPFITIAVLSTMLALMARSRGADFVQTIYFVLFRPSAYNIHKSTTNLLCAASELQIHLNQSTLYDRVMFCQHRICCSNKTTVFTNKTTCTFRS